MPLASTDAASLPGRRAADRTAPSLYRELPPRTELRDLLACRWLQTVAPARHQRVVPDGSVDIVWIARRELVVAGPATRAAFAALPAGSTTVGLRFAIGAGNGPLGLPLTELRDARVPLAELWGGEEAARLEDALDATPSAADQLDLLEGAVLARRAATPPLDRLALAAVAAIGGRGRSAGDPPPARAISQRPLACASWRPSSASASGSCCGACGPPSATARRRSAACCGCNGR